MSATEQGRRTYVFNACGCGNTNPKRYSAVGYRDWSRAVGVPMVPLMVRCHECGSLLGVKVEESGAA